MFPKMKRLTVATSALLVLLAGTACGGGSSYDRYGASTPAAAKTGVAPSGSPAAGGSQKQITITAKDFSFSTDAVEVRMGDALAITFKNSDSVPHTLTFYSDSAYRDAIAGGDSGSVGGGATMTFTIIADANLFYRCNIHPSQMEGEIDIKTTQATGTTTIGTSPVAALSASTEPPARAPAAPIDSPPPAPANPTVPPQAPAVAATPIPSPPTTPQPTHAVATPTRTFAPPPYGY
jgi:plastocyanin